MNGKSMDITTWRERQKQWERFVAWEAEHRSTLSPVEALHQMGEFADFYFRRHGLNCDEKLIQEKVKRIREMHRLLGQCRTLK
jgi:hypothetical protein